MVGFRSVDVRARICDTGRIYSGVFLDAHETTTIHIHILYYNVQWTTTKRARARWRGSLSVLRRQEDGERVGLGVEHPPVQVQRVVVGKDEVKVLD